MSSCLGKRRREEERLTRLPFLPPENLLSKVDAERGKFLELMGTDEGEKLSRHFLTPQHLNLGPFVLTGPTIKLQSTHMLVTLACDTGQGPGLHGALVFPVSGGFILAPRQGRLYLILRQLSGTGWKCFCRSSGSTGPGGLAEGVGWWLGVVTLRWPCGTAAGWQQNILQEWAAPAL